MKKVKEDLMMHLMLKYDIDHEREESMKLLTLE
jgi:hypothetical protein